MDEANQVVDGAGAAQSGEVSVEDRLVGLFSEPEEEKEVSNVEDGDQTEEVAAVDEEVESEDGAEESQDDQEEDAPELEAVQIGDETYEVPPAVAKAVMRHSEFMRRQQAVEMRERNAEEFHQIAQQKAAVYTQMEDVVGDIRNLKLVIQGAENGTDWNYLEANDPIEANTLRLKIIDAKQRLQGLVEHKSRAEAQISEAEQAYKAKLTDEGHKILSTKIKGWGPELSTKLFNFAVSHYGFSRSQAGDVFDPRNVQMLYDNYQYHQGLKAANSKVNLAGKRIPPTAPVMRPGSTPNKANVAQMKRYSEDRARLRRSGSVEDAARLINIS